MCVSCEEGGGCEQEGEGGALLGCMCHGLAAVLTGVAGARLRLPDQPCIRHLLAVRSCCFGMGMHAALAVSSDVHKP